MTSELLLAMPVAVAVTGAAACFAAWRRPGLQRAIALTSLVTLLSTACAILVAVMRGGPFELAIGGWDAPVGIRFRADALSAIMTAVSSLIGVAVGVFAFDDARLERRHAGFWPLVLLVVMGVCASFLTADLFNLYVWFEVMLISSFVLLALGGGRAQLAATHVYLVLSMVGSALFLIGVGLVYATTQTLDLATIAVRLRELDTTRGGLVLAIEALLLTSFALKAAVVPLMSWLPASYHTPLPSVSALFAALLTKVGVYAMYRLAEGVFDGSPGVQIVLLAAAIATMLVGVLGALAQSSMRQLLAFHIVSQIGYMVAALAIAVGDAPVRTLVLAAGVFYVVHNMLAKTTLFLIAGAVRRAYGTERLADLGGLAHTHRFLAIVFLLAAASLAGIPPLSGFWAKLGIITVGLEHGHGVTVAVAIVVGLLTLTSMLKLWNGVFAGPALQRPPTPVPSSMYAGIAILGVATLLLGLAPGWLFDIAVTASHQLALDRGAVVLGGGP